MNKILVTISVIFISLCSFSCEDDSPLDPYAGSISEFKFPLKTGNVWVYEEIYEDWGNDVSRKTGKTKTVTVGESVKLFGKKGYEINTVISNEDGTVEQTNKYAYTDLNGYYEYDPSFFDIAVQIADTVERGWIKIFRRLNTSSSAYRVKNAANDWDTTRVNELSYYIIYERTEDFTTYDDQEIKLKIIRIDIEHRKSDRRLLSDYRSDISYGIHKEYGIVSETVVELFGNGAWKWVLKNKNY